MMLVVHPEGGCTSRPNIFSKSQEESKSTINSPVLGVYVNVKVSLDIACEFYQIGKFKFLVKDRKRPGFCPDRRMCEERHFPRHDSQGSMSSQI